MQFHVRWGQSEPPSPTCHRNSRRSGTLFKGETKMQNFARFMGIPALALIATVLMASNPPSVAAEGDGMFDLVKFEATEAGSPATREQAIELLDKLVVPSLAKRAEGRRMAPKGAARSLWKRAGRTPGTGSSWSWMSAGGSKRGCPRSNRDHFLGDPPRVIRPCPEPPSSPTPDPGTPSSRRPGRRIHA